MEGWGLFSYLLRALQINKYEKKIFKRSSDKNSTEKKSFYLID